MSSVHTNIVVLEAFVANTIYLTKHFYDHNIDPVGSLAHRPIYTIPKHPSTLGPIQSISQNVMMKLIRISPNIMELSKNPISSCLSSFSSPLFLPFFYLYLSSTSVQNGGGMGSSKCVSDGFQSMRYQYQVSPRTSPCY